jgi:hypothetical protein
VSQQIDDDKKTLVTRALLNIMVPQIGQGVVAVGTPTVGHVDPGTIMLTLETCNKKHTQETIPVEYITGLSHGLNVDKIPTHKITKDCNKQVDSIQEGALTKAALVVLVGRISMEVSEVNNKIKISTRHSLAHSSRAYSQTGIRQIKPWSIKTQTTTLVQPAGRRVARVLALGTTDRIIAKTVRLVHPAVHQEGSENERLYRQLNSMLAQHRQPYHR